MKYNRPTASVLVLAVMACLCALALCLQQVVAAPLPAAAATSSAMVPMRCPEVPLPTDFDPASPASLQRVAGPLPRLATALGSDRRAQLTQWLAAGDNPNVCVLGSSLLAVAAGNGDIGAIDLLLAHGALPDQPRDANGGTPLLTAAGLARFEAAAHLIAQGADARASTDLGSTLLHALAMAPQPALPADNAAQTRMLDLAAEAIRRGARVNAQIEGPGSTALMFAALNGNQALVALLLSQGADASLRNARGQTAQDFAQRKGHVELVQMLAASNPARGDRPIQETR